MLLLCMFLYCVHHKGKMVLKDVDCAKFLPLSPKGIAAVSHYLALLKSLDLPCRQ